MSISLKIYKNVKLGKNVQIGDFCIIGHPPRGKEDGDLPTIIGDNAHIRSHTVIYAGNIIGNDFQTGHGTFLREENQVGDGVSIGTHSIIEHHVTIGNNVRIHSGAFIPEFSILEEDSWIGPHVCFTNTLHPLCHKAKKCMNGPTIKRGAKIGAGSVVLPDIIVGENALVGAGSVVTKDVPPRMVVVGNPAQVVKSIDEITCPYKLLDKPYD